MLAAVHQRQRGLMATHASSTTIAAAPAGLQLAVAPLSVMWFPIARALIPRQQARCDLRGPRKWRPSLRELCAVESDLPRPRQSSSVRNASATQPDTRRRRNVGAGLDVGILNACTL